MEQGRRSTQENEASKALGPKEESEEEKMSQAILDWSAKVRFFRSMNLPMNSKEGQHAWEIYKAERKQELGEERKKEIRARVLKLLEGEKR